jgi:hypothetical protein
MLSSTVSAVRTARAEVNVAVSTLGAGSLRALVVPIGATTMDAAATAVQATAAGRVSNRRTCEIFPSAT